jgi:hypothetical protein
MLDERKGVSYPDGFQAPDGTIYISYDRNRATDGEILLARFTEEDILANKLVAHSLASKGIPHLVRRSPSRFGVPLLTHLPRPGAIARPGLG